MNHNDHVGLLRPGIVPTAGGQIVWLELGAGDGAFTLALAELLGPGATIHTIDRDRRALERGAADTSRRYPGVDVRPQALDFTGPFEVPRPDGILMANSLHFVRDKEPLLRSLVGLLRPGGRFVLVEYDADRGNHWVPHPLTYPMWAALAGRVGLEGVALLGRVPSRFLGAIYSALALKPERVII